MTGKVVIYEVLDELGRESSLQSLKSYLEEFDPQRIFISWGELNDDLYNYLDSIYRSVPIEIIDCKSLAGMDSLRSPDMDVKKKILNLGLQTIAQYVQANNKSLKDVNTEITLTLFRAFFIFYSTAMPDDYENMFEERRMCLYGKIIDRKFRDGDILITNPWDAYWFFDRLV